jgi:hypothetical protein
VNKYSEFEQRSKFISQFSDKGISLFQEVPVFSRSVDLVSHDMQNQTISAIEFKTTNWKRAIQQVQEVSLSFDFLEICIIEPKTCETIQKVVNDCKEKGIGLYFFNQDDGSFIKYLESQKVERIWELQKKSIIRYIGEKTENEKSTFENTTLQHR